MRKTTIVAVTIILCQTLAPALEGASLPDALGLDELSKKEGLFRTTLLRSDTDFSQYDKLLPTNVMFAFRGRASSRTEPATGSLLRRESGSQPPNRENRAIFKKTIVDAFMAELGKSEQFQLAHDSDPGTLMLNIQVVDIVSKMPPSSARRDDLRGKRIADATVVFDLVDAETGALHARFGERRRIQLVEDDALRADTSTVWPDLSAWAQRAAADFRRELERARGWDSGAQPRS